MDNSLKWSQKDLGANFIFLTDNHFKVTFFFLEVGIFLNLKLSHAWEGIYFFEVKIKKECWKLFFYLIKCYLKKFREIASGKYIKSGSYHPPSTYISKYEDI